MLVRLWGPELQSAGHLGHRFGDGESTAEEVDAADPQRGQFAEPQPGVGEQPDDITVGTGRFGQSLHLLPAQESRLVAGHAGERHPVGGVPWDAAVADGQREQQREDAVRLTRGGRSRTVRTELGDPPGDLGVGDVGQPVAAPGRQDVGAEEAQIPVPGARLDLSLRREPLVRPRRDRHPAALRCGPGLGDHR
nr:hypothetical protein [uncultured Modestobacter sp.]